jgi:hypothetical protein
VDLPLLEILMGARRERAYPQVVVYTCDLVGVRLGEVTR